MGQENAGGRAVFRYNVYGISLRSEFELALPGYSQPGLVEVEIAAGPPSIFLEAIEGVELRRRSDWCHYAHLPDGSIYVRWLGLGEFLVSADGKRLTCGRHADATSESFQVYLLGQALSFALVRSGFEPLHATALEADGEAFALLGSSGYGKSSLAACFLASGHALLTDDLLVMSGVDGLDAHPGPRRIKLFPDTAHHFLGRSASGVRMNALTEKLIIPLDPWPGCTLRMRAIYSLAAPHEARHTRRITIEPLSSQAAFLALVGNTFNYMVVDADRLQRQVRETTRLVGSLPVKKLSYPRGVAHLPEVRDAILEDLRDSHSAKGRPAKGKDAQV